MESVDEQVLSTLLTRLALGDRPKNRGVLSLADERHALGRVVTDLRADEENFRSLKYELRLRLAMHLSPIEALSYDLTNHRPRHALIATFLRDEFQFEAIAAAILGQDVAQLLTAWEEERGSVTQHLSQLAMRDGLTCANCHLNLADPAMAESVRTRDEYKPYYLDMDNALPEVDHVEAVSCLGTNNLDNLQILCRLCNQGKSDGLGVAVNSELKNAGRDLSKLSVGHRAAVLYYVIERDGRACSDCRNRSTELTVRRVRVTGAFARSNLRTVCYEHA